MPAEVKTLKFKLFIGLETKAIPTSREVNAHLSGRQKINSQNTGHKTMIENQKSNLP
jgi:hypothetical protein